MSLVEDVMINILRRLSVKVLLRCRSVCKSWKSLIASSHFINAHINFNRINTPQVLIRSCINYDVSEECLLLNRIKETYLSFYGNNETFDIHNKFDVPWVADNGVFVISGSCNGLICLSVGYNHDVPVYLWNPLINKAVYIPKPIYINDSYKPQLGFGYDIATNDYKLVRFTRTPNVEVYRLSTRIWEDITHLASPYKFSGDIAAYVNGAAHWIVHIGGENGDSDGIVLFDMQSEVFKEMKFSSGLKDVLMSSLIAHQGTLCLVHEDTCLKYDIWLMKEYGVVESWVKQYSVDIKDDDWIPRCFLNNGELLWEDYDTMTSYDPQSKQFRVLLTSQDLYSSTSTLFYQFYVCQYVPSFVLHDQKVDWEGDTCILGSNVKHINQNLHV